MHINNSQGLDEIAEDSGIIFVNRKIGRFYYNSADGEYGKATIKTPTPLAPEEVQKLYRDHNEIVIPIVALEMQRRRVEFVIPESNRRFIEEQNRRTINMRPEDYEIEAEEH